MNNSSWVDELPIVLLGLRTALRSDNGVSAAEMTFGRTLRMPGDFYDITNTEGSDDNNLVDRIRHSIAKLKPSLKSNRNTRSFFVHPDLKSCSHVFVRDDAVRRPLKSPYDGPYRVLKRSDKVYTVQLPDRKVNLTIDRLKPAYILEDNNDVTPTVIPIDKVVDPSSNSKNKSVVFNTRSGRQVRPPARFVL